MADHWYLDPQETLQFVFDWAPLTNASGDSNWLDRTSSPLEIISSQTCTADSPGPTIESSDISSNGTKVELKASLGGASLGNTYKIVNQIVTNKGQTAERTAYLHILNK